MERYIGLDIGDRRIGVAVSDPLGLTAQPIETYSRIGYGPDVRHFCALADQYETKLFVCGLPKNMDGTQGGQIEKVMQFTEQLEKAGLEIFYEDERLTTVLAEGALLEADMTREQRKKKVDMVAATYILQSWLDRRRAQNDTDAAEEDSVSNDEFEMEDSDGNTIVFRRVATVVVDGRNYHLLNEVTDSAEGDSVFLEEAVQDGSVVYQAVEDEQLLSRLYDLYLSQREQSE